MSGMHAMVLDVPPMTDVAERLGTALRRVRENAKVTQGELAKRMGVAQGRVSQWEAGSKTMQLTQIEQAEDVLEVIRGAILAEAGFVALAASARAALAGDTEIEPFDRDHLVGTYDLAWRRSQALRDGEAVRERGESTT